MKATLCREDERMMKKGTMLSRCLNRKCGASIASSRRIDPAVFGILGHTPTHSLTKARGWNPGTCSLNKEHQRLAPVVGASLVRPTGKQPTDLNLMT